jgi:hypothetical protein
MSKNENVFNKLRVISVKSHTKKKNGLSYLSWAWAWDYFKQACPDATYMFKEWVDSDGVRKLYSYDEDLGYMVATSITVCGETHEMMLPVMDGANKAMKNKPYTYKVAEWKNGKKTGGFIDKTVQAATMFDINTTLMRCVVKNMAMFGLALYVYSGEDLPDQEAVQEVVSIEIDKKKFESFKNKVIASLQKFDTGIIEQVFNDAGYTTRAKKKVTLINALVQQTESKDELLIIGENIDVAQKNAGIPLCEGESKEVREPKEKKEPKERRTVEAPESKKEAEPKKEVAEETSSDDGDTEPSTEFIVLLGGSGETPRPACAKFEDEDVTDETIIRREYAEFVLSNLQCKIESTLTMEMMEEFVGDTVDNWTRLSTAKLLKELYSPIDTGTKSLGEILPEFYA